ncbi:MAG: hypothetical protein AAFU03_00315, partial [Bacteroidota bacterium]
MAINTGDNLLSSIPLFSPNQVLRAEDLNKLSAALFQQMRQNRVYNVGLGIINGLRISWDNSSNAIVISRGLGISSDGYAFEIPECRFTHFRSTRDLTGSRSLSSNCNRYSSLLDAASSDGVFELSAFNSNTPNPQTWRPIISGGTVDAALASEIPYCLVLIYREETIQEQACFNDCEAKGASQSGEILAVLIPQPIFEAIPEEEQDGNNNGEETPTIEANFNNLDEPPRLQAFGRETVENQTQLKLCRITSWELLYRSYWTACSTVRDALVDAYSEVFTQMDRENAGTLIDDFGSHLDRLLMQVYPSTPESTVCKDIQYLYSYFHELILTYEAFYALANDQTLVLSEGSTTENETLACAFPGHLSLGIVTLPLGSANALPEASQAVCREAYYPPANSETSQGLSRQIKDLYDLMSGLATAGNVLLSTLDQEALGEVRLTPDTRRFPYLQGRAVPFYYNAFVASLWRVGEQPNPRFWQYTAFNNNHPLLSFDESSDFYRIEGHLGQPLLEEGDVPTGVKVEIEELRDCLNLAFDVKFVNIDAVLGEGQLHDVTDTEWDVWYKNTRTDLLNILRFYQGQQIEGFPTPTAELQNLIEFLETKEFLQLINDWDGVPGDCCTPLPLDLISLSLESFIVDYDRVYGWVTDISSETSNPRLDDQMAYCIRDVAIKHRLFREEAMRQTTFACFAQEHPGLMHLGGVPKGGTLILVYKEITDSQFAEEVFATTGIIPGSCRQSCAGPIRLIFIGLPKRSCQKLLNL